MKSFLKTTLAVFVALILFSIISTILSVMMLGAFATLGSTETSLQDNSVLKINLSGTLVERVNENSFDYMLGQIDGTQTVIGLNDLRSALDKAAQADEIKALYLNCGSLASAPASAEELRSLIENFKTESGKPVYAYGDNYSQAAYWIASVADTMFLNPQGTIGLVGMVTQIPFFHKALDKLGVKMEIFKVGTFKSAVEPYILDEISEPNRLQNQRMLDGMWSAIVEDIATSRSISADNVNHFVNEGMVFGEPTDIIQLGLIDGLKYRSEFTSMLKEELGKDIKFVSLSKMKNAPSSDKFSMNKVAVLYAIGELDSGAENEMNSEDIVKELNRLADNDDVKAVVLRVNSPGGSAFGSEQMWFAAKQLRAKKPLIVSMSDYAASGGYYMSCIADTIVAQPTTLTGSIGIFGMFPNFAGVADKNGVNFSTVKTNELADLGNTMRPMTNSERAIIQNHVNRGYELFISRCAEGRGVSCDEIKQVAEGRVWTGADALELGLVDVLGGLDDAIAIAAQKAELTDNYTVAEYPAQKDALTELIEQLTGEDLSVSLLKWQLRNNPELSTLNSQLSILNMQGAQAIMPYRVEL
ncbi:MAG: signal peptide peptidase SppA [Paludibacteraceae bacterium]|nr:signal peptide peptidase SppA [Paludibacteraceae bacterium]